MKLYIAIQAVPTRRVISVSGSPTLKKVPKPSGVPVGEAFFRSFYLDQACTVNWRVQSAGAAGAALMTLGQPEIDRNLPVWH